MRERLGALEAAQETVYFPFSQLRKQPREPKCLVASELDHIERKGMIGQQQGAVVAGPPPLRAASDLDCDVPPTELETAFPQIGMLVVQRHERPDRWAPAQRIGIRDDLRLKHERRPVADFHPAAQ